ncbi:MAG: RNA 2',3'-cyclic phosphodiesterase [Nanohaloarchaea archaeon]|nr:RNA 2',3'-cyclic phosphodiesterase [Candidatus Nanohaloarchaea archaeon]
MARVFTAFDIEDEKILEELRDIRDRFDLGFKPVPCEKMHLTFEFFKDVDEDGIEKLKRCLDDVEVGSFHSRLKGVGAFPSQEHTRVVWAGVENGKFHNLYRRVSSHGVESDNGYDFVPHVTLLRVEDVSGERKRKLRRMLREFEDHDFGGIKVDKLKLFRSDLKPEGSEYSELYVKNL